MMNSTGTSVNEASPLKNHPPGGGGSGAFRDDVVPAASAPETAAVDGRNKLPSSKYKGVVPQPNGRWGAQIYEKHQRVWLGTFNDEVEAAVAYDIAAQRYRGRHAVTNFKPLCDKSDAGAAELIFLSSHSKAEIVDMLRKHTYQDELLQSLRSFRSAIDLRTNGGGVLLPPASAREQLFEKAVTPSDVGKLNRLVIPKQHAEKHFPLQMGASSSTSSQGALLNFEDVHGKLWRFRYSYWNSSQSYVLTKGWSRFVKEKSLKAGDVVTFLRSVGPERQLYIDWRPNTPVVLPGRNAGGGSGAFYPCVIAPSRQTAGREVKLFGVDISRESLGSGRGGSERKVEVEVLPTCSQTWERQFFGTWRR